MSGRLTAQQVDRWAEELKAVGERHGRHFGRAEPRQRALGYVRGLLSDTERKNGWQLADHSVTCAGALSSATRAASAPSSAPAASTAAAARFVLRMAGRPKNRSRPKRC